ncbi:hypothetical protein AMJ52_08085 [candidate division TA06 bacterium DG_78]|uniref:Gingipain domain-containing protein n=1 Tax=candidate division TA06 bacterium DG_78 TaxID=1703772 RepID=A0A0S7YB42_UNCT6|nr:MAG: hypothetical protein AMJ52_08085 [candidate division TA06 bacterium DG_78]
MKVIWSILLLICFAIASTYNLSYNESQFTFEPENGYDRVTAETMLPIGNPGDPELPAHSLLFIIPNGQKVGSINVVSLDKQAYSGTYDIYPLQPSVTFNEPPPPWVPQNPDIYETDALYPESPVKIIEHGKLDGIPVVSIVVAPLLYNPVNDSLYLVENVSFSFNFEPDRYVKRPEIRSIVAHEIWYDHVSSSVYNDWEVDICYTPPASVASFATYSTYPTEPKFYDVVIVTPPDMEQALKPLERWLFEKGMPTKIVTTDWIYSNYDGSWDTLDYAGLSTDKSRNNATQIKEFLYDSWYSDGTCFALLVGIAESGMPYRQLYGTASPPVDMYYQDFDGFWWGQEPSRYEEIWIGRVPAWDSIQAAGWTYKRLAYEKEAANGTQRCCALWITQDADAYWNFPGMMDNTIGVTGFDQWMIQHKVVGHECNPGNHGLIDTLDIGYGFCNQYGHGAGDVWKTKTYGSGPKELLVSWDWSWHPSYDEFRNKDRYYVVWSLGCGTAWFDTVLAGSMNVTGWHAMLPMPCCAEGFVSWYNDPYPLGAVAYDGGVRPTSTEDICMHMNFISMMRSGSVYHRQRYGVLHAKQKYAGMYGPAYITIGMAMNRHAFGSPEMEFLQDGVVRLLANEHVDVLKTNETSVVTVTVYDVTPLQGMPDVDTVPKENATVCLYKGISPEPEIFEVGRTNSQGQVEFTITPKHAGLITVTSTAKDFVPHQTKIRVLDVFVDTLTPALKPKKEPRPGPASLEDGQVLAFDLIIPTITTDLRLKYSVPEAQNIRLTVYDITGAKVACEKRMVKPGVYDYSLSGLSSGVYLVRLEGEKRITRKTLIVR